ncbi:MAG: hypothetical protein NC823_01345, partial [Candidatus Omnitrophica bacterium]|nr:hypothetical protein [Candidatus Omnitrophota bacterium]
AQAARVKLAEAVAGDRLGVIRFSVSLPDGPDDGAQPQPTTMLGYELDIVADAPGKPSTKLRIAPGRVPELRMRVSPVIDSLCRPLLPASSNVMTVLRVSRSPTISTSSCAPFSLLPTPSARHRCGGTTSRRWRWVRLRSAPPGKRRLNYGCGFGLPFSCSRPYQPLRR